MNRCELTELPTDQCACSTCRPDLKPQTKPPENYSIAGKLLWESE